MPQDSLLEAFEANVSELLKTCPRDRAVAVARAQLREACHAAGRPVPVTKSADGPLGVSVERTSIEKGLLLGPKFLTEGELADAHLRAEMQAAGDARLGVDRGGEHLAEMFWAEKARRTLKGEPGPSDVHVPSTEWKRSRKDRLPGGVGAKTKPEDVDAHELELGIAEEMEHTDDPEIAQGIALDHLTEDPHHYTRARKADRSADPGVMIALRIPIETAKDIALIGGEPPEQLHVTLAYLGRMSKVGPTGLMSAAAAIGAVAHAPILRGHLSGLGRFAATESSDGKDVLIRLVDVPGLTDLRARLVTALEQRGVNVSKAHDFTPHLTLAYLDPKAHAPRKVELRDVYFDAIELCVNDSATRFPLGQPDPLLQAKLEAAQAVDSEPKSTAVEVEAVRDGMADVRPFGGEAMSVKADGVQAGDIVELAPDMSGNPYVERASASTVPAPADVVTKSLAAGLDKALHETPVPFAGPQDAPVVFVSGAPSELELARGEALVGPDGAAFVKRYLAPLGLMKSEVAVGFACPVLPRVPPHELSTEQTDPWREWLVEQISRWPGAAVVALGKAAEVALGDRALLWLPHPCAARLNEARYDQQIERKIKRVRKALDDGFAIVERKDDRAVRFEIIAGRMGDAATVKVTKSVREEQIVYGVVLDPYEVDTQQEWVPPAVVQASAHDYLRQSRVIGREHTRKAGADLVESFCVPYPSQDDYRAAMSLQPHRVWVMPYGEDKVHSGAWIAGVKLGDAEWQAYKRGDITGFSIGGFSAKTKMERSSMPKVEFVPLVEERVHG